MWNALLTVKMPSPNAVNNGELRAILPGKLVVSFTQEYDPWRTWQPFRAINRLPRSYDDTELTWSVAV